MNNVIVVNKIEIEINLTFFICSLIGLKDWKSHNRCKFLKDNRVKEFGILVKLISSSAIFPLEWKDNQAYSY